MTQSICNPGLIRSQTKGFIFASPSSSGVSLNKETTQPNALKGADAIAPTMEIADVYPSTHIESY